MENTREYHPREVRKSDSSFSMLHGYQGRQVQRRADDGDYVVLVRCMRVWQRYVQGKRQRRDKRKRLLENLAIAINYHEQTLVTKGFLSIIKFRI